MIANVTNKFYASLNAVTDGVTDLRKITAKAEENLSMYGKQTILFIDEIHRFNKRATGRPAALGGKGTDCVNRRHHPKSLFQFKSGAVVRSMIFELQPLKKADIEKNFAAQLCRCKTGPGRLQAGDYPKRLLTISATAVRATPALRLTAWSWLCCPAVPMNGACG